MASPAPLSGAGGLPPDAGEALARIEKNTAELLRWTRYLLGAVIVLIVVLLLVFV